MGEAKRGHRFCWHDVALAPRGTIVPRCHDHTSSFSQRRNSEIGRLETWHFPICDPRLHCASLVGFTMKHRRQNPDRLLSRATVTHSFENRFTPRNLPTK